MKNDFAYKKNRISKYLRKENGATIVFALVVFMIAAIVSVTIVNVAMSNLSRTFSRKSNEQARLAVVSAAKYLESTDMKDILSGLTTAGDEWTVTVSGGGDATAAEAALSTTIKWTDVNPGTALIAEIKSGDYKAECILSYDATDGWEITGFKKI